LNEYKIFFHYSIKTACIQENELKKLGERIKELRKKKKEKFNPAENRRGSLD